MNILIIPEDHTHDQFILKPLFQALLKELGKPRATVEIYPLRGGCSVAMKIETIRSAIREYGWGTDHFVLCVDRDGDPDRAAKLQYLQEQIETEFAGRISFLAAQAWEELETWLLAGLPKDRLPPGMNWQAIRAEVSVKEKYFAPVAAFNKASDGPGGGRQRLGIEAARSIQTIRQKCAEDFDDLAQRLATRLA